MLANAYSRADQEGDARTLPPLRGQTVDYAFVGGGFAALSTVLHILDYVAAVHKKGASYEGIECHGLPRLPGFNITIFNLKGRLGDGEAFNLGGDRIDEQRLSNTYFRGTSPIHDDSEMRQWILDEKIQLKGGMQISRNDSARYAQYQLQKRLQEVQELGCRVTVKVLPIQISSLRHEGEGFVSSNPGAASFTLIDSDGNLHGSFHGVVAAHGHTKRMPVCTDLTPLYVDNPLNTEALRTLVALNPRAIMLKGFQAAGQETMHILNELGYAGNYFVATPAYKETEELIAHSHNLHLPIHKTMSLLDSQSRISVINGYVSQAQLDGEDLHINIKNGLGEDAVNVLNTRMALINCSSMLTETVSHDGRMHDPFLQGIQDQGLMPRFRADRQSLVDTFGRPFQEQGETAPVEGLFLSGAIAYNNMELFASNISLGSQSVSFGMINHAIHCAWHAAESAKTLAYE